MSITYKKCIKCGKLRTMDFYMLYKLANQNDLVCIGEEDVCVECRMKQIKDQKKADRLKNKDYSKGIEAALKTRAEKRNQEKRHKDEWTKKKRDVPQTCSILKQHAEVLADDPDRLSTDFIKSLMHTDPKCD